jgi:hypothetical protein
MRRVSRAHRLRRAGAAWREYQRRCLKAPAWGTTLRVYTQAGRGGAPVSTFAPALRCQPLSRPRPRSRGAARPPDPAGATGPLCWPCGPTNQSARRRCLRTSAALRRRASGWSPESVPPCRMPPHALRRASPRIRIFLSPFSGFARQTRSRCNRGSGECK